MIIRIDGHNHIIENIWLFMTMLQPPVIYILNGVGYSRAESLSSVLSFLLLVIGFWMVFKCQVSRLYRVYGLLFIGLFAVLGINYLIYPENRESCEAIIRMLAMNIMAYYAIIKIDNYSGLYKASLSSAYFVIPLTVILRIFVYSQQYRDYGNFSIMLFPFVCLVAIDSLKNHSIISIAYTIGAIIALFLFGNRISILLFIVVFILYLYKRNPSKYTILALMISILLIIFEKQIGIVVELWIGKLVVSLNAKGILSRTIAVINQNNIFSLSGREAFYENAINQIKTSPIIGNGVGADMIYNYRTLQISNAVLTGSYSHNGFLEMAVEFGLIIALVVWILLLTKGIKKYMSYNIEDSEFDFFLVFFSFGVLRSLLGYPYWYNWYFWAAVGMIFVNRNKLCVAEQVE